MGARVVLNRNISIDSGWVNGTLAVVTGLIDNCIVRKLTNTAHWYPVHGSDRKLKSVELHTPSCVSNFPYKLPMVLLFIGCKGVLCKKPLSA